MNTPQLGLVEGFFGPEWSWTARHQAIQCLASRSNSFYFYAPKRDRFLRKNWFENHPEADWNELKKLRMACRKSHVLFGVALSPFEIHENWNRQSKDQLKNKVQKLSELEFDLLGLFFDDMRGSPDLAQKQSEIVNFVQTLTKKKILFCPTYYSLDPILDKVFGQRSVSYLEDIGNNISQEVEILWTGHKVISPTITSFDLLEVTKTLQRKPFIWDNFYANDGPRQCQFLSLKPFTGRDALAFASSAGWALNLMNQPYLSLALFLASVQVLTTKTSAVEALAEAMSIQYGDLFAKKIKSHQEVFCQAGLNRLDLSVKENLLAEFSSRDFLENKAAQEIIQWLQGEYIVGAECLTD